MVLYLRDTKEGGVFPDFSRPPRHPPPHGMEQMVITRIPTQVVLPFGYRISVRQLTDAEMDKQDANADGIWDADTKTIYIRKRLAVTRRRYILAHELGHAWLDWQHRYLDEGKARN